MTAPSSPPPVTAQRRAALSYGLDIICCVAVTLLLRCWLSDMNHFNPTSTTTAGSNDNVDSLLFLSKSFLTNGFCLAPKLFENTHFSCAAFDFFCACICILAMLIAKQRSNNKKKNKSMILPGNAIYFLAHSYGHYTFSTVVNKEQFTSDSESTAEKIQSAIILTFILSVGPLSAASFLIQAKKLSPPQAYIMAGSILTILVGFYHLFLFHPSYALLYINISIMLAISLPKLLFVQCTSEQDVQLRSKERAWQLLSRLGVLIVIVCEPFFCDVFFARIGGHFLFDLSLAVDVVTAVLMEGSGGVDGDDDDDEMKKVKVS